MKRSRLATLPLLTSALVAGTLTAACDQAPTGGSSGSWAGGIATVGLPRVLFAGLANPGQLAWGPDNFLWVTEKTGKRVTRIDPSNGSSRVVLSVPDAYTATTPGLGDGLLGLAFNADSVFVAYDYNAGTASDPDPRGKIARYRYDDASDTLTDPTDVLTGLPASAVGDGGRLTVGPDQKLYLSLGDQDNDSGPRACLPNRAQDLPTATRLAARDWTDYTGKVLRIDPDGGIPADNPVIRGVRSHVFSYGHHTPQDLAFGGAGQVYEAERGARSDDEVNLLSAGKNYGWPFVAGYRDDQSYRYANWSAARGCAQLRYDEANIPAGVPRGPAETAWSSPDYVEPLKTLYTVPNGYDFADLGCAPVESCGPAVGASGLAYLPADTPDPALANTLLVGGLHTGTVYALPLSQDGSWVRGEALALFRTRNRYRDIAVNPDHTKIYIAADSTGQGAAADGQAGQLDNPGTVLEFALSAPLETPRPLAGPSPTPSPPVPAPSPTPSPPFPAPSPIVAPVAPAPAPSSSVPTTSYVPPYASLPPLPSRATPTPTPRTSVRAPADASGGSTNPLLPTLSPSGAAATQEADAPPARR